MAAQAFAILLLAQPTVLPVVVVKAKYELPRRYQQKAVAALYSTTISGAAKQYDIPTGAIMALIGTESGWEASALSRCGAVGLTQLMPETAADMGVDPWEPRENIVGGAKYLAAQFRRFGSWELAFAAYNAGPGLVRRLGRVPRIAETEAYVRRALTMMESGRYWR